jgi:hypothetical protein
MGDPEKKRLKAEAKRAKKSAKAELKAAGRARQAAGSMTPQQEAPSPAQHQASDPGPSPAVRYAESVRGILYLVVGASLVVALILGQRGVILSLDDIIDSLFAAVAGKAVLALIGLALLIYGLKHLRLVR